MHIQDHAKSLKGKETTQFAQYLKTKVAPENMAAVFAQVKNKIMGKN